MNIRDKAIEFMALFFAWILVTALCYGWVLIYKAARKPESFTPPSVTVTVGHHTNGHSVVTVIVQHPPWTTTFVTNLGVVNWK